MLRSRRTKRQGYIGAETLRNGNVNSITEPLRHQSEIYVAIRNTDQRQALIYTVYITRDTTSHETDPRVHNRETQDIGRGT